MFTNSRPPGEPHTVAALPGGFAATCEHCGNHAVWIFNVHTSTTAQSGRVSASGELVNVKLQAGAAHSRLRKGGWRFSLAERDGPAESNPSGFCVNKSKLDWPV